MDQLVDDHVKELECEVVDVLQRLDEPKPSGSSYGYNDPPFVEDIMTANLSKEFESLI